MDDEGRVRIPQEVRDALDLAPGKRVRFQLEPDGSLRLVPLPSPKEFLDRLVGVINDEARRPEAGAIDPLELKRIWDPTDRLDTGRDG